MADNRKDLPPTGSANFLEKLREAVQTYMGNRGDKLDRGITVRDLAESGIVKLSPGFLRGGSTPPISGPAPGINNDNAVYEPDLTPPPTPTGFTATAAISNLLIDCDPQTYTQGHGHANSKLYGITWTEGPLPVFADAQVITEFNGNVASYSTNPSTTWHLWLTWVTVDGVESNEPAGGTNGVVARTGEDVALLLDALTGEITESQLYTGLNTRIDLIDGNTTQPALPYPLATIAALQDGLNQRMQAELDAASTTLLDTLTTINSTTQTMYDAGVYVEPSTGTVKISGLEATKESLTAVDIRLSAAEGDINLKASTTYVDGAIAAATLNAADMVLFEGMDLRVSTAEVDINSLQSAVNLKASNTELDAANVRITTAEADIDALEGQIVLKVDNADYEAVTGGLDARLGTAEVSISSIGDISAITSMVQQGNTKYRDDAQDAETLLRAILNNEASEQMAEQTLAYAREDLTAYTDIGLAAEATKRTTLAARLDTADAANAASVLAEQSARVTATDALASDITTLAAAVDAGDNALAASIQDEAIARATADEAEATKRTTLQATVNGNTSAIEVEKTTRATETGNLFAQYTVKLDVGGKVSGYGLASSSTSSEFAIRADRFYIAPPYGSAVTTSIIPFAVQATATTINGVSVPAGVYMNDAYIKNGTITNAKIGNAQIDDAKISSVSVTKLAAGSIKVGDYIQSASYVAGSAGWRIHGNGTAELSNAIVRGTVYASSGSFTGDIYASNGWFRGAVNTGSYQGYAWPTDGGGGAHLSASGLLVGNANLGKYFQITSVGNVYAPKFSIVDGNATFSGNLSAAGGTFKGTLTADAINAVNTINVAGEAITKGMSAFTAGELYSSGSWVVAQTLTFPCAGSRVFISASADSKSTVYLGNDSSGSETYGTVYAGIAIDGVMKLTQRCPFAASYSEVLTAGSRVISLYYYVPSSEWDGASCRNRSLFALETKR